jgi:tetratricopeptide (TPR) repeat protein
VDRVALVLRAAEAANQSGQLRRALSLARAAVDTIDANVEPLRAARAHDRLGQYLLDTLSTKATLEEVLDACGRAVELTPGDPPTPLRARVTTGLTEALLVAGRFGEARRWCEEALAVARAVGTGDEEARALVALAMLEHHHGDTDSARALLHDARSRAVVTGNRLLELQALRFLGNVEFDVGNLAAACAVLDDGTELAEQSGLAWSAPGVEGRIVDCVAHYAGGDWDGVERLAAVDDRSEAARGLSAVGPLWLASVRDAFSNRVVGWKAADRADTSLVLGALEYGLWGRHDAGAGRAKPDPAQPRLIHHSDRGCHYTAIRFTQRLDDAGVRPSMGSVGDSYDNALAENFFSTLKIELVYRTSFPTREEAELALFRYIDGWYNPHRIQRRLGWRSPVEFEADYYRSLKQATTAGTK